MNAVLALIQVLLPAMGGNAALVSKIIEALVALIPILITTYKDLVPIAKNIIIALKADPSTTIEQLDALDIAEAQLDAAYEVAAAAAEAEDTAAAK